MARDHGARPVHELLRQPLVERVGEAVLDRARALLPEAGVGHPGRAVRDVGPGPDRGDAREQRVEVALRAVDLLHVRGEEVLGDPPRGLAQETEDARQQARVRLRQHALEVRHLADLPQQAHGVGVARQGHRLLVAHECGERALVLGVPHAQQEGVRRLALEAAEEGERREVVELVGPPLQVRERREAVRLDRLHEPWVHRAELRGRGELAVGHVAPGAARDLAHLGGSERPRSDSVELAEAREHHVVDVEVQPHPDRVGRHQVVDVACLIQAHLRVTGPRRERAEHESRSAALAPQPRGDLVQLAHREDDHGRAPGQLVEPLRLRVAQRREARAALECGVGQQLPEQRPDRLGPDQPRLQPAAGVLDAAREDVAALAVGGELHLVDREEVRAQVGRHRLDRAHPVGGLLRDDALFARHERHGVGATQGRHAVVVLARQQPQRKADHAGGMRQHPLDRQVRLAGVGRAQEGGDRALLHRGREAEAPGATLSHSSC